MFVLSLIHAVQILKKIAWFVVLAPASSDQITLLNNTAADRKLSELPLYKDLLSSFLTKEVRHPDRDMCPDAHPPVQRTHAGAHVADVIIATTLAARSRLVPMTSRRRCWKYARHLHRDPICRSCGGRRCWRNSSRRSPASRMCLAASMGSSGRRTSGKTAQQIMKPCKELWSAIIFDLPYRRIPCVCPSRTC